MNIFKAKVAVLNATHAVLGAIITAAFYVRDKLEAFEGTVVDKLNELYERFHAAEKARLEAIHSKALSAMIAAAKAVEDHVL